jgi:hypothetical protein
VAMDINTCAHGGGVILQNNIYKVNMIKIAIQAISTYAREI